MTEEGPDWAPILDSIGRPPGANSTKNRRVGLPEIEEWQALQYERTGADVAVAMGGVDTGNGFDGWGFVSGVVTGIGGGIQNFLDAIGSAFGGASSGNTAATVNAQAVEIAEAALNAEAATIALQAQQATGGSSNGVIAFVDTLGDDGDALSGTDWGTSGPSAGDVVVRGTTVPCVGIADGEPAGMYWVPSQHEFATSDQRFEVVVGQGGGYGTASYLLIHCDASVTEGAYLMYAATGLDCGRFTRSGSVFTFTPFSGGTWAQKIGSGSRVEIQNSGTQFDLSVNGTIVKTVTGSGVTMDASHVTPALALERKLVVYNPGLPWETTAHKDSLRPSAVLISDYVPIVYEGSGARMYRTSTSAVGVSSGVNLMPSSFFAVVGAATDDITCDLTTGKFTVAESGWYHVSFRVGLDQDTLINATNVGSLAPYPLDMVLYRNGSVAKYVGEQLRFTAYDVGPVSGLRVQAPGAAHGGTSIYLAAGDYVQLGYDANSASGSALLGEATGTKTWFEIARMMEPA